MPTADPDENRVSHFDSKILTHKSYKKNAVYSEFQHVHNELLTVKPAADLDESRVSHFDSKILTHKSYK